MPTSHTSKQMVRGRKTFENSKLDLSPNIFIFKLAHLVTWNFCAIPIPVMMHDTRGAYHRLYVCPCTDQSWEAQALLG